MAKITRSVLKKVIKECLVEILIEGLNDDGEVLFESLSKAQAPKGRSQKPKAVDPMVEIEQRRKALDSRRVNSKPQVNENVINHLAADNSIMADVFRDTAQTTLLEQTESRGRQAYVPADAAAKVMQASDPLDVFEGSNNWAALAFSDAKPGK